MADTNYCGACGARLMEGQRFCGACGAPVTIPMGTDDGTAATFTASPPTLGATAPARVGRGPKPARKPQTTSQTLLGCGCLLVLVLVVVVIIGAIVGGGSSISGGTAATGGDQAVSAPTATPTDVPANPGDEFIGWTGAMAAELRICGLAAHQIPWTHYDMPMVKVFPEADTPSHGCDFAAENISYDTVPFSLPDQPLTAARDKLVKWARALADAYRGTDNPSSDLLDQAAVYKRDATGVIVAEGDKLHRPVDADTLLPAGQTWDSTTGG